MAPRAREETSRVSQAWQRAPGDARDRSLRLSLSGCEEGRSSCSFAIRVGAARCGGLVRDPQAKESNTATRLGIIDRLIGWSQNLPSAYTRSEEHTSELQSLRHLVCRLLLEKKTK